MSRVSRLLAVLAALAVGAYGDTGRIVNGTKVPLGKYPFVVSLGYKRNNDHFCGGSILNENWVLTAAHCVSYEKMSRLRILTSTTRLDMKGRVYAVEKLIMHELYNKNRLVENDVALIKVRPKFQMGDYEAAVKLPTQGQQVTANTSVTVCGWGHEVTHGKLQNSLMEVDLLTAVDEDCDVAPFNEEKLCSYYPGDGKGDCQGDSGGPVFLKDDLTQVGIVSYGGDCGVGYNVYAEVSNYIDWINERIN